MSEINKRILKSGDNYIDWFGRPSSEEAYLAQFVEQSEPEVQSVAKAAEEPKEEVQVPLKDGIWMIEGSEMPYEHTLLNNNVRYSDQLPTSVPELLDLVGIAKISAGKIQAWVNENTTTVIVD